MKRIKRVICGVLPAVLLAVPGLTAAEVKVLLPLGRTAYQTNEMIAVSVVRGDPQALPADNLVLTLTAENGETMSFTFPVSPVAVVGNDARAVEHLHLNGWLLRPGRYRVAATVNGATAEAAITVYSHVRRSTYRTIHWGAPASDVLATEGADGLGFNLLFNEAPDRAKPEVVRAVAEATIRAGVDIMGKCIMGGCHQHDCKLTNDWSDPYVYIGAIQRGADSAFTFRTMPNAIGGHLHDEPGLTYLNHPHTGVFGPHDIPQQRAAYQRAFGVEPMWQDQVNPKDPANLAQWTQINEFRLGFMDAFWKCANDTFTRLKPGYLPVTQSQYGVWALYDGYYFNVARTLPVISGHGGYDDFWLREFNPVYFLEFAQPRQTNKPNWYLPDWGGQTPDHFRLEHYLCFAAGIQGLSSPPPSSIGAAAAAGILEVNKAVARLGTIFAKPAYTPADLGLLYSKSNFYVAGSKQLGRLAIVYLATKMAQYPISAVLEEDVLDGSLAANHKAVVLTGLAYLDPRVVAALSVYAAGGGVVLMTDDCTVEVPGAVKLGLAVEDLDQRINAELEQITDAEKKKQEAARLYAFVTRLEVAAPVARALKTALTKAGVPPAFATDSASIAAGRQVRGEIEYLFAINFNVAGYANNGLGTLKSAVVTIALPADGRPVYDAMLSGPLPFLPKGQAVSTAIRFGPGQMKVLARPARPLGGVQIAAPRVVRDLTQLSEPVKVEFAVTLMDAQGRILAGAAPLRVRVSDAQGAVRYDLYRATDQGICPLSLPLAANDAAGTWTVAAQELLANHEATATFIYRPVPQGNAVVAGATRRAVVFGDDQPNIYRFFRTHRAITIVKGSSEYSGPAAERLAASLKPYNVSATIVSAADANRSRDLTPEEAKTWCGTQCAGDLKPGRENSPQVVGFDVPGPVILVGNPTDNPLIKFLADRKVLPYALTPDVPGRGHGLLAWHLHLIGHDLESVAVIASDAAGMNEAVGTLFELAIGIEPLTPLALPVAHAVRPAAQVPARVAEATVLWRAVLPDRAVSLTAAADGQVTIVTADHAQVQMDAKGAVVGVKELPETPAPAKPAADISKLPKERLLADRTVKQVLAGNGVTAVAYWGGSLQVFDDAGNEKARQLLPQDVSAMVWAGDVLIVGLADGQLLALKTP